MALPVHKAGVDYEVELENIRTFVSDFVSKDVAADFEDLDIGDNGEDGPERPRIQQKYMRQLQRISNRDQQMLVIELEDVMDFMMGKDDMDAQQLAISIINNTRRYISLFCEVVDALMPEPTRDISHYDDILDVVMHQRRERNQANEDDELAMFPPQLMRRYSVYFKPLLSDEALAVRDVKGTHLGRLITVRGIVTRVSEVKPLLLVNAYTCESCGSEIFQDISNRQFAPLTDCLGETCSRVGTKNTLNMQTRACRFSPFQEIKIQELADQVPVGHIPRTMTVHVFGGLTRQMNPGDEVYVAGIYLPTPYTGFQAIRAGLLTDTFLEVHHIHQLKRQYNELQLTPEIAAKLEELKADPALYNKLAWSIAPEIYGHEDVKKALLLLLVGGVTKAMGDGMKIRGDINICLMGDPGVAKSQLLKYIAKIAPRGVYTTGKGSSGVGLTAAVMRDPVTDEMILEGGALVLADNGICCIDEFDKMEESDRTAIHEVMEQQTISISKAGISTTLNARTSILAAANPLYGRYNPKVSPVENINLPAALLSRFDLLFLLLDKPNKDDDERLASHVTHVHMFGRRPEMELEPVDPLLVRHYIALARQKRPLVPYQVSDYVVDSYVRLRKMQKDQEELNKSHSYTTARTLLGILRLAQALARLRFADVVELADVDEGLRLMEKSKESLDSPGEEGDREGDHTITTKIFRIVKDMAASQASGRRPVGGRRLGRGPAGERDRDYGSDDEGEEVKDLLMVDIRERVIAMGFTETQFMDTVLEYEGLNIWSRVANGSKLQLVS